MSIQKKLSEIKGDEKEKPYDGPHIYVFGPPSASSQFDMSEEIQDARDTLIDRLRKGQCARCGRDISDVLIDAACPKCGTNKVVTFWEAEKRGIEFGKSQ